LRTWQSNRQGTRWLETTLTDPFSLRRSSPISVLLHGGQRLDLS
jgi:hypothetical protein